MVGAGCLAIAVGIALKTPGMRDWENRLRMAWEAVQDDRPSEAAALLARAYLDVPTMLEVGEDAIRVGLRADGQAANISRTMELQMPGRLASRVAVAGLVERTRPMDRAGAIRGWVRAAELDPWSLSIPVRLADLYAAEGDVQNASLWAQRAIENDEWLRLDPVVRLDRATVGRMESLAMEGIFQKPESGRGGPEPNP